MNRVSRRLLARYSADKLSNGASPRSVAKEIAAVLVNSGRQNQAELTAYDIAMELENSGQNASAQVMTSFKIDEKLSKQITVFVKKAAKVDNVSIINQTDGSIIGGIRIDTAKHSWDRTVKRQLDTIRETV